MRHTKAESDATSMAGSSPPRSPRGRPAYFVMSPAPSQPDAAEKMSLAGSTPAASPLHYHFDPAVGGHVHIHHSRESTTGRFSAPFRPGGSAGAGGPYWRRLPPQSCSASSAQEEDEEGEGDDGASPLRCYACAAAAFGVVFGLFALVLWGASRAYKPVVVVKSVVFENYHIQAGTDATGVPTKMMTVNATVKVSFHNPATFFGVAVTATPLDLFYLDLKIASGTMKEFYQPRRSARLTTVVVTGQMVPLYGGGSTLHSELSVGGKGRAGGGVGPAVVPLRLEFVVRARAHVLGELVKSKFYRRVHCGFYLHEARLGKPLKGVTTACEYHDGR